MAASRYRPENQGEPRPDADRDGDPDLLTSLGYYGAVQTFVLGLPALWLLFLSLLDSTLLGPCVLTACTVVPGTIAAGRRGHLPGTWPRLTAAKLGTGDGGGYHGYVRRAAHLCSTLLLAVFLGIAVGRATTGTVAVGVTALLSVLGTALAAYFERPGWWPRGATAGYHVAALVVVGAVAAPLDSGLPSAVVTTVVVALLAVVAVARPRTTT